MGLRVGGPDEGALCVALPCKGRAAGALPQLHPRPGQSLCAGDGVEHSVPARPCRSTVRPGGHKRLPSAPVWGGGGPVACSCVRAVGRARVCAHKCEKNEREMKSQRRPWDGRCCVNSGAGDPTDLGSVQVTLGGCGYNAPSMRPLCAHCSAHCAGQLCAQYAVRPPCALQVRPPCYAQIPSSHRRLQPRLREAVLNDCCSQHRRVADRRQ